MTAPDPSPRDLRVYSVILALEIGEPAAQVFHRVWYFCARTESGKEVDGRRWIRNSFSQWWKNHFPHWGLNTVKRAFEVLMDRGMIQKGSFNQAKRDRTLWYSVNFGHPLVKEAGYIDPKPLTQNGSMHQPKMGRSNKHGDISRKTIKKDRSSSHPGGCEEEDGDFSLPTKPTSQKQGAGNSGNGNKVSPETEGEVVVPPPDPDDDLLKKVYFIVSRAVDFLAIAPRTVNLWHYLQPFQSKKEMKRFFSKEEVLAMDTPGPSALEAKCDEFVDLILRAHFKGNAQGGIKAIAMRACRGGFLNRCGFRNFCERGLPDEYSAANPWANVIHVVESLD